MIVYRHSRVAFDVVLLCTHCVHEVCSGPGEKHVTLRAQYCFHPLFTLELSPHGM